jgi:hypothetical protein
MDRAEARKVLEKYILLNLAAKDGEGIDCSEIVIEGIPTGENRLGIMLYIESNVFRELREALDVLKDVEVKE